MSQNVAKFYMFIRYTFISLYMVGTAPSPSPPPARPRPQIVSGPQPKAQNLPAPVFLFRHLLFLKLPSN